MGGKVNVPQRTVELCVLTIHGLGYLESVLTSKRCNGPEYKNLKARIDLVRERMKSPKVVRNCSFCSFPAKFIVCRKTEKGFVFDRQHSFSCEMPGCKARHTDGGGPLFSKDETVHFVGISIARAVEFKTRAEQDAYMDFFRLAVLGATDRPTNEQAFAAIFPEARRAESDDVPF